MNLNGNPRLIVAFPNFLPPFHVSFPPCPAALKNDDADDSEGEDINSEEVAREKKEALEAAEVARLNPVEKQPTGRVVGIFKRNWRP